MADNLLDKASILLTPTAYRDGGMLSVKPNENLYGSELVTNGDFATNSDWSLSSGSSIANGKLTVDALDGNFQYARQNVNTTIGGTYKLEFEITEINDVGVIQLLYDGSVIGEAEYTSIGTHTLYFESTNSSGTLEIKRFFPSNTKATIDNVSVKEDLSGDFTFSRSSAATRVNAQGLVENVQIISPELVSNGNFSQIGTEEVSNGNFSQQGSELVTNGDFATDSDWTLAGSNVSISGGKLNFVNATSNSEFAQQSIVAPIGKTYKITLDVSNLGSGESIKIRYPFQDATINTNGTHILYGVGGTANVFRVTPNSSTASFSIDNVSVKEVGQDWTLGTGWSIGDSKASNDGSSGSNNLRQSNILTIGSTYKITITVSDYVSGNVQVSAGATPRGSMTANGTYTFYQVATPTDDFYIIANAFIGSITNISVKEVGQDWSLVGGSTITDALNIISTDGSLSSGKQLNVLEIGKKYKYSFDITSYTSGNLFFIEGSANVLSGLNATGTYTGQFISTGTSIEFKRGGVSNASISNISVKEITDDTDLPRINYEGFSYQDSLGSEEVVNGDFSNGLTSWTNSSSWWSIVNGEAYHPASTSMKPLSQGVSTEVGKEYKISVNVNIVSGTPQVFWDKVSGQEAQSLSQGLNEIIVTTFKTNSNIYFGRVPSINTEFYIDNVSVKEYLGQEVVPDSGCGSWLLEPQSTNLVTYSEDFSQSYWTKSSVTLTSGFTAPDGSNNAYKVEGTIGTSYLVNLTVNQDLRSIYVRTVSGTGQIKLLGNSTLYDVNEQWTRVSYNPTSDNYQFAVDFRGGTDISEVLIWGAQVEQQSYATSYIPTNGATNTRLQDIANNSGNSTLINSTEGVLYAEIAALANGGSFRQLTISDGSGSNRVSIDFTSTDNQIRSFSSSGGSTAANMSSLVSNATEFNKVAVKYKLNDYALWINGVEVATDTSAPTPIGLSELAFDNGASGNDFYGKNKALAVFKEALTDANLRSLTYPNPVATTFDLYFDTIAEQFTFTRGSEATFVNAQGLIESTASNDAPRIDYSTGVKAFLLEPQSTNLITYSSDFSNSAWTKQSGVTATYNTTETLSPDGTYNATKLIGNGTTGIFDSVPVSGVVSRSIYIKSITGNVNVILKDPQNTITQKTLNVTTQWQRFELVEDNTISSQGIWVDDIPSSGIYIWGAQLEQQSYATSYIPTDGASATRNQELCNNATPVINSEEGTLYAEISALNSVTYPSSFITISDGTYNNRASILFSQGATNQIRTFLRVGGATQIDVSDSVSDVTDFNKIAFSYKLNDFKVYINGALVSSDTSGSVWSADTITKLSFSEINTNAGGFFGNTKDLKYYPKALADVQLEDLTTI